MPTSARAITHCVPGKVELRSTSVRDPGPGEILVKAIYTTVSPGTEIRTLNVAGPQEPFVPGYAAVGEVVAAGPGAGIEPGQHVFCGGTRHAEGLKLMWGAHISHAVRAARECYLLQPQADLLSATLAKLGAIAFHGLRMARVIPGEQVAVIGLGPIGQFASRFYTLAGCQVVATDRIASRVELARRAGVNAVALQGSLAETFRRHFPQGAAVVVDSTGAAQVLDSAVELLREGPWGTDLPTSARFIVQGSYPADISFSYQKAFMKETQMIFTRDGSPADFWTVFGMMERQELRPRDLISQIFKPEEAPQAYQQLQEPNTPLLTIAFDWR